MWAKVAEEMAIPWRAAEAMHWQLGEADMARRAGVIPFSLSNASQDAPPKGRRGSVSAKTHSRRDSVARSLPPVTSSGAVGATSAMGYSPVSGAFSGLPPGQLLPSVHDMVTTMPSAYSSPAYSSPFLRPLEQKKRTPPNTPGGYTKR
jgi:hypothetical protein